MRETPLDLKGSGLCRERHRLWAVPLLILQKPLLFRSPAFHAGYFVGKAGDFFANKAAKLSILASFYISIFISLSAHAAFSVWALFFFVLRCAFVVLRFFPMRYTGCTRRDAL
jgi:hypothetical protein